MKSLYLLIDIFSVIVPFIFSFHPKINFYKTWKASFLAHLIVGFVFIVWDSAFTKMGIWGFNERYITGIYLFNLPIEEILFFICIPYACLFTYYCFNLFYKIEWNSKNEKKIVLILATILLFIGIMFYNRLYTSLSFISTSILLYVFQFVWQKKGLGKLFSIYPFLLIPFFIVNGILTGTGLEEAVVWYNNSENLSIRILTIPIEDMVYGFELILLNIFLYKYFLKKMKLSANSFV